jgi:hypothetical protein
MPRRFRVCNVTLPRAGELEQELVPTLIDDRPGLLPPLALRWVMRSRRIAVGEKTLADDLRAASLLYSFCEEELGSALDELFADGHRLNASEIEQAIEYLRTGRGGSSGTRSLATTAQLVSNVERFLRWLAKPIDRGGTTFVSPSELVEAIQQESERLAIQSNALLAQLALIEGNTKELGIDPDALYKPLLPPDRRVAGPFKRKGRRTGHRL